MDNLLLQLGVGGAFALLIIREVLRFLKRRQAHGHQPVMAGEQPTEFWQAEQRKAVSEMLVLVIVPILTNQMTILNELRLSNVEVARSMAIILDRLTERR